MRVMLLKHYTHRVYTRFKDVKNIYTSFTAALVYKSMHGYLKLWLQLGTDIYILAVPTRNLIIVMQKGLCRMSDTMVVRCFTSFTIF